MPSVLVTGANRGLGLEFTRQYLASGWRVVACCRRPDEAAALQEVLAAHPKAASTHALDVGNHSQIETLARHLADEPIDVLLNNAGTYGPNQMVLGRIDYAAWAKVLAVNTLAPLRMAECFLDHLACGERKVIACLTSRMGSIAHNIEGRHYLYRSSKAALNSAVKSLSVDLRPRGITAVVVHPGWVRTDMGGPQATLTPEESVRDVRQILDRLTLDDSGKFFSHDGSEVPW